MAEGPPPYARATVRLQLNASFGFEDARRLVPYLARLGASHLYASPFLMARKGSPHGYDITDHNRLNPELGSEEEFERLIDALHAHDMGLILDFVPNHMGVGGADNAWWLDVLEWGRASPYAGFFDIDWVASARGPHGKVLLPFLGDHYGSVLEAGQLALRLDQAEGSFSIWYYRHRFPIALRHYGRILAAALETVGEAAAGYRDFVGRFERFGAGGRSRAARSLKRRQAGELKAELAKAVAADPRLRQAIERALAQLNGTPGEPQSFWGLHRLLEAQSYRVAYWRVAADEINYRRFFDINDLAGLRIERPEVFEATHALVLRLIAEGKLQGLRLDHVDGLYDPEGYCHRLQRRARAVLPKADTPLPQPFYVLVEKILARHEHLRESWPVAGTTGYEFMNLVAGLFVDPAAERALTDAYHRFVQRELDLEELVVAAKKLILAGNLTSELHVLAYELDRVANQSWRTRDHTPTGLREALIEVIAHFPVYRTYITEGGVDEEDRRDLDWAFAQARKASELADPSIFDFLYGVLSTDLAKERGRGHRHADVLATAMRFQQLTGPTMAKAVEDTAFYRHHRLVALNEVGGEPARFGVSPAAFHHLNRERQRRLPFSMVTTATHDHKRGEDTRLRIAALSELPRAWRTRVTRWARLNRFRKQQQDGQSAPGRNDEYLLYQTLVGAWPLDLAADDAEGLGAFADRLAGYMIKATREAKQRSSWAAPNGPYEAALEGFVRAVLDPRRSGLFLADLCAFQERITPIGAVNGLAQTLLRLTVPGVPDLYQGTELWDLSLVDPDNRRPVDWRLRERLLRELRQGAEPRALVEDWRDGRIKQHVVHRTLAMRAERPALFAAGDYLALDTAGTHAERVVAFARRHGEDAAIVVVPRLVAPLLDEAALPLPPCAAWGDTRVALPDRTGPLVDRLGGARHAAGDALSVGAVLADLPVALLSPDPAGRG